MRGCRRAGRLDPEVNACRDRMLCFIIVEEAIAFAVDRLCEPRGGLSELIWSMVVRKSSLCRFMRPAARWMLVDAAAKARSVDQR